MIKNTNTTYNTTLKIKHLLLILFFTSVSWGQTVVTVSGGGTVVSPNTPTAIWTTPPTGVSFSNWSRGSGVTWASANNGLNGSGFNTANATTSYNGNVYYAVTLTADATHTFTLNNFVWIAQLSGSTNSCNFTVKYSNDGGTLTDLGTAGQSISSSGSAKTLTFTAASTITVAAGKSIVIYAIPYAATASSTTARWSNNSTISVTSSLSCTTPTTPSSSTPSDICQGSTTTITGSGSTNATSYTFWSASSGGTQYTNGVNSYTVTSTVLTTPSSLTSNTTYYVQGENGTCISASRQAVTVTVTTPVTQAVSSSAATSITTSTASINGGLDALGICPSSTAKGFVYSLTSTNATPTNGGPGVTTALVSGLATGSYTLGLTGLTSGATYSFRAYVYDGTTYVYGTTLTFTTIATPPTLTASTSPTSVDNNFTVTFPTNSAFASAIGTGSITINGVTLTAGTDYTISGNNTITFTPSVGGNASIHTPGTYTISVNATGYTAATVSQQLTVGAPTKLVITTQPTAPATNGAVLATQPVVTITDKYGNLTTSTATITATASGGTWTMNGTSALSGSGTVTFAGLTATSAASVPAASITFTSLPLTAVVSNTFAITGPPPANNLCSNVTNLTIDAAAIAGTLSNANPTAGNTFTYFPTKNDVWYSFTPSCTGDHTITLTYTKVSVNTDIDFDVFTGPSCPTSGTAPVNAQSSDNPETVTWSFNKNTTYYIRAIDYWGDAADFTIGIATAVAKPVVTTASISGTTGTALTYNIVATNTPTSYALASGTLPSGLSLNTTSGAITGTPTTGGTYVVTVTATNCGGTSTAATLTFTIYNDFCPGTTLTVNAAATSGNMTGATYTSPFTSKNDVWYTFTPSCTGTHTITVTGFTGDIDIELFSGSCPASTTYLYNSGGSTSTESISAILTSGTVYYLRVLAYDVTAQTTAFTAQATTTSSLTINNTGSPAAGNISAGTSSAVIMGFTVVPNCATTYNLTAVTITKTGTTTIADLSNFKIYYDANGNGIVDVGDSAVSGAGIALTTSMSFTLSGQTSLSGTRNYLLVADASSNAVNGHTILASIVPSSNVTASVSLLGTAVGNTQTITPPTCTAAVLSSITPATGPVGTEVTITASSGNLTGATVKFNGIAATIVSATATKVIALVPVGATTGVVTVTDSTPCNATTTFTVLTKDITSCQGGNTATELFMSEITDSNYGSLTYVEIYNGMNVSKSLSDYSIKVASNGSTTSFSTIPLNNVTLAPGGIYVLGLGVTVSNVCSSVAGGDASYANQTYGNGSVNFETNKNDFIGLYNSGGLIDSWGKLGDASWASGLTATIGTEGAGFRRKNTATLPNITYASADWTIADFAGTVCANNDYTNIGSYSFTTASVPTITTNPAYLPTCRAGSLTVAGTEGYAGGNALAYQWYFATAGASSWTAVTDAGVYTGSATATLSMSNVSTLIGNQYYCQILENTGTCYTASNAVKISDSSITWNGTNWLDVNGAITATSLSRPAVLNANYNTTTNGSFDACSLVVNAGITATIKANTYINIQNDLTINATATLSVENNGSLVQIDDTGVNTGSIAMQRTANIRKTDYVYWSAPVASFAVNSISPSTNYMYKWNTTVANSNNGQGNWQSASGNTMTTGIGYIVRGPSANSLTVPSDYTATFTGVPNNGVVNVSINRGDYTGVDYKGTNQTWITNYDDNMNLIGNPYPSAINVHDFLAANNNIEGAVQIWTHGTQLSNAIASPYYGTFAYNYTSADYITYNGTGTTSGPLGFNGYIGAGQAFFVKMLDGAAASGTITFNNALRNKAHSNNQFYRTSDPSINHPQVIHPQNTERHRIWLDLIAPTGTVIRTMVGYVTGATLDKDRLFDAYSDYENDQNFFSLIGKEIMTIQGRPLPFDVNDTVPMGVAIPKTGNYTIAIGVVDGLFAGEQQTIYLEDKLLNVIHNLSVSPYSFNIDKGIVKDRFVLRYTDRALGTIDFKGLNNSVVVASGSNQITIKSFIEDIKSIAIYDVLGREVFAKNNVNAMEFLAKDLNLSQQALLVKITLTNGQAVVKKIVY